MFNPDRDCAISLLISALARACSVSGKEDGLSTEQLFQTSLVALMAVGVQPHEIRKAGEVALLEALVDDD